MPVPLPNGKKFADSFVFLHKQPKILKREAYIKNRVVKKIFLFLGKGTGMGKGKGMNYARCSLIALLVNTFCLKRSTSFFPHTQMELFPLGRAEIAKPFGLSFSFQHALLYFSLISNWSFFSLSRAKNAKLFISSFSLFKRFTPKFSTESFLGLFFLSPCSNIMYEAKRPDNV